MEAIPENILNLIEQKSFDELDDTTRQDVLLYISREEYDSMYHTAKMLVQNKTEMPQPSVAQKDRLMNHFMHNNHTTHGLWRTPVQLWKAASIMILLGAGWLLHWQTYQQRKVEYVTKLDTVYLEKEVPFKVYDTVYYKEEAPASYTSNPSQRNIPKSGSVKRQQEYMNTHAEPKRRGVSAKDDSLIQSFKFVTL
jgi:hypothetical protein